MANEINDGYIFDNVEPLFDWTIRFFYLIILFYLISIISDYYQIDLLERIQTEYVDDNEIINNDKRQQLISISILVVFLIVSTLFLIWTYRVYKNLQPLGARGLQYSPRWAVGSFFIPIINLFRPNQIFNEIWKASDPELLDGLSWRTKASSPIIYQWRASFVIVGVYDKTISRFGNPNSIQGLINSSWASIIGSILVIISASITVLMIMKIHKRQNNKYIKMNYSIAIKNQ